jgi:signal transduction histidine kinase
MRSFIFLSVFYVCLAKCVIISGQEYITPIIIIDSLIYYSGLNTPVVMKNIPDNVNLKNGISACTIFFQLKSEDSGANSKVNWFYGIESTPYWAKIGSLQQFTYTNLQSGYHEIDLKAEDTAGKKISQRKIRINIEPSFWTSSRFLLVILSYIFGALAIVLALFYTHQIMQERRMFEMRRRIAADLHDDVAGTLASIALLGELVDMKIRKKSAVVLKLVEEHLREQVKQTKDVAAEIQAAIWAINPKNTTGKQLIQKIQETARDLFDPLDLNTTFNIDNGIYEMMFFPEENRQLVLIARECFHNIFKHSKASNILIEVLFQKQQILLKIADDGVGFDQQQEHLGNGLGNLKDRAAKLNGKLWIKSHPDCGTTVYLQYPKISG